MNLYGIGLLLDHLNITTKELGNFIGVDRSLVSKWRTGTRKIDIHSPYFNKILDLMLLKNQQSNNHILEGLFCDIYSYFDSTTADECILRRYIKRMILNNDFSKSYIETSHSNKDFTYLATIPIYNGEDGKQKAIVELLDFVLIQKKHLRLSFIFSYISNAILFEDEIFRRVWIDKVISILAKGHTINLLFSPHNIDKLILFLSPVLFHKNFHLYRINNIDDKLLRFSLHIVHNHMIVYTLKQTQKDNADYTSVFVDQLSIAAYTHLAENYLLNSTLILKKLAADLFYKYQNSSNLALNIDTYLSLHSSTYFYNLHPSNILMSEELYTEILQNNITNISEVQNALMHYSKRLNEFNHSLHTNEVIHFYPLQNLLKLNRQDIATYETPHTAFYPALKLTSEQFKRHLQHIIQLLKQHSNFKICLTSNFLFPSNPSLYCWCRTNDTVVMFDHNNPLNPLLSDEATFVNSISTLFEHQFMYIPSDFKDKDKVIQLLEELSS